MSRRSVVLLVSGLLSFVLALAALFVPVPYAAIGPGPTFDTLSSSGGQPIVKISGHASATTDGQLRLVTVEVYGKPQRLTLGDVVRGWLDKTIAVVPIDNLYPPTKSTKDIDAENTKAMLDSQLAAKTAALAALGIPVTVTVASTDKGFAADGVLKPGDVIVSVDGTAITSIPVLTATIGAHKPGEAVSVTYRRGGAESTVTLTTKASPQDANHAIIGISPDVTLPFTIDIQLPNVGGPSAGLMFSLAIYDKLSDGHLAGGMTIAGTGTIDVNGVVGPIGGIQQKVYAARRDGAIVFLVPHSNCPEIKSIPPGLELVDVTTMADAVSDLQKLQSGGKPAGCTPATAASATG